MTIDPTHSEAPLVALVTTDPTKFNAKELETYIASIRSLRAVPAQRAAAVTKSKKSIKATDAGIDIDSLL